MADVPGLTFSPLGGPDSKNPNDPNAQSAPQGYAPIQDAIRTLSFRIPKFGGATSPIPPGLLNAGGMGGLDLQGILRSLFGFQPGMALPGASAMGGVGGSPMGGGGSAPPPSVTPGNTQPTPPRPYDPTVTPPPPPSGAMATGTPLGNNVSLPPRSGGLRSAL